MSKIFQKCTAEDIKWIGKIILKDLKIGFQYERILRIYHPEALDLFNITSNLREVCKEFENTDHTLTNVLRVRINNFKIFFNYINLFYSFIIFLFSKA